MKKTLFSLFLLVTISPIAAMEQDQDNRGIKRPGEEINNSEKKQKITKDPKTLLKCCEDFMGRERKQDDMRSMNADEKNMQQLSILPIDVACKYLESTHQSVINRFTGTILNGPYHEEFKSIIINRMPLDVVDNPQFNDFPTDVKCLYVKKVSRLQTIENIVRIASEGTITNEVAFIFVKLLKTGDLLKCVQGTLLSPEAKANGNEARIARAMYELLIKPSEITEKKKQECQNATTIDVLADALLDYKLTTLLLLYNREILQFIDLDELALRIQYVVEQSTMHDDYYEKALSEINRFMAFSGRKQKDIVKGFLTSKIDYSMDFSNILKKLNIAIPDGLDPILFMKLYKLNVQETLILADYFLLKINNALNYINVALKDKSLQLQQLWLEIKKVLKSIQSNTLTSLIQDRIIETRANGLPSLPSYRPTLIPQLNYILQGLKDKLNQVAFDHEDEEMARALDRELDE